MTNDRKWHIMYKLFIMLLELKVTRDMWEHMNLFDYRDKWSI